MLVTVFAKKGKNCAPAVSTAVALRIIPAERYQQAEEKTTNNENLLQFERKIKGKSHRTKTREFQPISASFPSLPHTCFSCQPNR